MKVTEWKGTHVSLNAQGQLPIRTPWDIFIEVGVKKIAAFLYFACFDHVFKGIEMSILFICSGILAIQNSSHLQRPM